MDDDLIAIQQQLADAGVPSWAPFGSGDRDGPRYYAWVDDDGVVHGVLVGNADLDSVEALRLRSARLLAGLPYLPDGPPQSAREDLRDRVAMAVFRLDGVGCGRLSRQVHRPLRDLVAFTKDALASWAS